MGDDWKQHGGKRGRVSEQRGRRGKGGGYGSSEYDYDKYLESLFDPNDKRFASQKPKSLLLRFVANALT